MPLVRFLLGILAVVAALAGAGVVAVAYPFWSLGLGALIFFALMATYQIWLWSLLRVMAQRKTVVVNVQEGTGVMVMQNGKAIRFLTACADTDPDENWNLAQEGDDASHVPPGSLRTKQQMLHGAAALIDRYILPGGMRWIGFPFMGYELYKYNFRWEVLRNSEPRGDEDGLVSKRQLPGGKWVASFAMRLDYIYTKDAVYYFEVLDAETRGTIKPGKDGVEKRSVGMPIKIRGVETVRIVNPYLALIFIHDWTQSTFDLLLPSLRSWVAKTFFEDIVGRTEAAERQYDDFLRATGLPTGAPIDPMNPPTPPARKVEMSYGVRIKRVGFVDVAAPEEYTKASIQRAEAEQQAVRIQTLAVAEAGRIKTVAAAEVGRIKSVNKALEGNTDALRIRELEALENIGAHGNVFVLNTKGGSPLINIGKKDEQPKERQKEKRGKRGGRSWDSNPGSEQDSGDNPPPNQAG